MKKKWYLKVARLGFLILVSTWFGCETEDPAVIFDPNDDGEPAPVINSIDPPDLGIASIGRITLIGENFSSVLDNNLVYFADQRAVVESASHSELVVIAPDTVQDSLTIRLSVIGAYLPAEFFPYQLEPVNKEIGGFTSTDNIRSIAVDSDENVYVHLGAQTITMITPAEETSEYATTSLSRSGEMRFGPGGYLYIQKANSSSPDEELYRVPPGGGASELYITFPERVGSFDFDANHNLFAGSRDSGFYVVNTAGDLTSIGKLIDFEIRSVRIYEGYVYTAAEYRGSDTGVPEQAIWKCEILSSEGDLGDEELVFDWATETGDSSGSVLQTVTFDENGDMYIGTNNLADGDPVTIVRADGSFEPLYPGLLSFQSRHLVWGTGVTLYENRGGFFPANRRLVRIIMSSASAPYYGRQ